MPRPREGDTPSRDGFPAIGWKGVVSTRDLGGGTLASVGEFEYFAGAR